ncbi:DUF6584 family protein [Kitasatospora sp. NPDC092948]|uniref:DUF6584 family protein n=1 Tax=Kitasatospora sp. NPDC092948 TaxID=3364088 RepID=UPI0038291616
MSLEATLARAEADLAAGRVPMARQRLRSLVEHHPTDLTVRHRLAAVYRLYGEPAEAGRWNYLDESADPAETAAFEARYPSPLRRMIALRWLAPEDHAPTETARARLAALRGTAVGGDGGPVTWTDLFVAPEDRLPGPEPRDFLLPTCLAVAVVLLVLAAIGAVAVVRRFL